MAMKAARRGAVRGRAVRDRLVAVAQTFDNKAGHYELVRIEGNTAYYTFTNLQGTRTDATMAVMTWRRLQQRALPQPDAAPTATVLGCMVLALALAAMPCAASQADATERAKAAAASDDPPTRSITLPGLPPPGSAPRAELPGTPASAPDPNVPGEAPQVIAASLALPPSSGDHNADAHYKTAVVALKSGDLAVAADEMGEASKAAPENALIYYGLAVIQTRHDHPERALPNMEKALSLGLKPPESARAADLIASIRYAIKKNEAEQKKITPLKLWGSYESAVDEAVQDFEDHAGKTIFATRTPLSREMFLWNVDGESTVRGHWVEKETLTEEVIFSDARKHDPKPKTFTEEHWWLVTLLINPDGSLDGSRKETCTRETGYECDHPDQASGKVVTFKGHVEPNGDITITQDDGKPALTMKKKSRVASAPPTDVRIRLD